MLTGLSGCDCGGVAPAVPGLRMACRIVSTCRGISSFSGALCATCEADGLPGERVRECSKPFSDGAPLVGGDAVLPCDESGDRTGDGERLAEVEFRLMNWMPSAGPNDSLSFSTCSACTTSAKEMKLRRLTSSVSRDP